MYLLLENLWWKRHISTEKEEIFTHKKVSLVICISDMSPHLATDKICCETSGEQEKKKTSFFVLMVIIKEQREEGSWSQLTLRHKTVLIQRSSHFP